MPLFLAAGDTWIERSRRRVDVLEFKGSGHRYRHRGVTASTALSSLMLCPVVTGHPGFRVLTPGDWWALWAAWRVGSPSLGAHRPALPVA